MKIVSTITLFPGIVWVYDKIPQAYKILISLYPMDTQAKIKKIFEKVAEKFINLQTSINEETNSYDF
jgi:hypothetical protein